MTSVIHAPQTTSTELRVPVKPSLDSELQAAREHARRLTAMYGTDHPDVAMAWDAVEEMLQAKAKQRESAKSAFARYCEENPSAPEARMYDV